MPDLPENRADWLMAVIVRLIRPDIVSALRQVEAEARAGAMEENKKVREALDLFLNADPYETCGAYQAEARAIINGSEE